MNDSELLAKLQAIASKLARSSDQVIRFRYTNHRGVTDDRMVYADGRLWYGTTEHHKEPAWLFGAWDRGRRAWREFAVARIEDVT